MLTIEQLMQDLTALGIGRGDIILVKVDLVQVGLIKASPRTGFLEALFKVVGNEGTIVVSTFTTNYFIPFISKKDIFTINSPPNTGGFAKLILAHPDVVRSTHPTNSFAAVGPHSEHILQGHDASASSYLPIQKLIEIGAKCINVGCVSSSPGFTTTHWAQYVLGQSVQNILSGWLGAYYFENGQRHLFKRRDFGGHNPGAIRLYGHYISNGILKMGKVGNAAAVLGESAKLYEIDLKIMKEDPRYILCSSPTCFDCRATWLYNKREMILYFLFKFPGAVIKQIKRRMMR